jgi:excinuclease ABC subunit A
MSVVAAADWVIDLGPTGAAAGGAEGTPATVAAHPTSRTAPYLAERLEPAV